MAATGQNALACLMLGMATAMLFLPLKKWHRVAAIVSIVIMFVYNLTLASRAMIVVLCCLLLIGLLYPKMKQMRSVQKTNYVLSVSAIFLTILVAYALDIGGIREFAADSLLFGRLDGSFIELINNSDRMSVRRAFLSDMLEYPLGGLHMYEKYGYAHDLLLDGYDEYGFIVFGLLLVILLSSIRQLAVFMRRTAFSKELKLTVLLMNVSVLFEFFVEPILAGMPWLFACYCLMNGCVTAMNRFYFRTVRIMSRCQDESIADQSRVWRGKYRQDCAGYP